MLFRSRPWSYPRLLLIKWLRLWYGTEKTDSTVRDMGLLTLSALLALPGLFWLIHGWLPVSPIRDLPLFDLLAMATLGYFVVLHFVTLPLLRYMLPIYPLLFLGTAQLAVRLLAKTGAAVEDSGQLPMPGAPD